MRRVRTNDEGGNSFDKHFRERLRNSEVEPSANLWDKIGYRLDQEREKIKYNHWYYALLILLVPLAIANIYTNYDLEDYHSSLKEQEHRSIQGSGDNELASLNNSLFPFPKGCSYPTDNDCDETESPLDQINQINRLTPIFSDVSIEDKNALTQLIEDNNSVLLAGATASIEKGLTVAELESLVNNIRAININPWDIDDQKELFKNPLSAVRGFHIGVDFGSHRNWFVFRQDALNPMIISDVEIQQPKYGTQYGVSLGYDFSHKFGMEIEGIFRSAQGIRFQEIRYNGKLVINAELDLDYMHFPVIFKYKWSKISSRTYNPRVLNLLAGLQYSRLKTVDYISDWSDFEVPEDMFNKNELGITFGLEYDFFLHKNFYISFGARGTFLSDASSFPYFNAKKSQINKPN